MQSQIIHLRASPATFDGLMDADRKLEGGREPDLILALLPADGKAGYTLAAMAEVWPTSLRLGCETANQFADAEITTSGCLQFFWLEHREAHRIRVEVLRGAHDSHLDPASVDLALRGLATADTALLLVDGLRFPVRQLLAELHRRRQALPARITGALASGAQGGGANAEGSPDSARVFYDKTVYPSAALLVAFEGVEAEIASVRDFDAASPIYTVTRADGSVVWEIDGEGVLDWYRRFFEVRGQLAPMPQTALGFPLLITGPDPSRRGICRCLRSFDEPSGAVTYWGDVQEGDQVRLGLGQEASLTAAARNLVRSATPEAALLLSFVAREALLGDAADGELADLSQVLGPLPFAGGVTFGEISQAEGGHLVLQNQTALLILLRETTP